MYGEFRSCGKCKGEIAMVIAKNSYGPELPPGCSWFYRVHAPKTDYGATQTAFALCPDCTQGIARSVPHETIGYHRCAKCNAKVSNDKALMLYIQKPGDREMNHKEALLICPECHAAVAKR